MLGEARVSSPAGLRKRHETTPSASLVQKKNPLHVQKFHFPLSDLNVDLRRRQFDELSGGSGHKGVAHASGGHGGGAAELL